MTNGRDRITDVAFKTATEGALAVLDPLTRQEVVLATQDGGVTWTQPYPAPAPNNLWHFSDAQRGIGAGTLLDPAAILISEDGGAAWRQVSTLRDGHAGEVTRLSFPDSLHGWAAVAYEKFGSAPTMKLFRTTDGAATWTAVSLNSAKDSAFAASGFLLDTQHGYAFTEGGQAWVTHDGGETFQPTDEFAPRSSPIPTIRAQTGRPPLAFQLYAYYPYGNGWAQIPLVDDVDGFYIEGSLQTRDVLQGCDHRQATSCQILLFVSVDGVAWTRYDLVSVLPTHIQYDGGALRWMGRPAGPLYRTDDGGQTWTQIR
ncbi:MAG: WD40/YVTN/BNR-like repeat-containing protein [Thermomicrobiales bacterium]